MKKIVRLTESDLNRIVTRVLEESKLINEATTPSVVYNQEYKYELKANGSGLLFGNNKPMCVKVEAPFLMGGTFAQGIESLIKTNDGGFEIVPTKSKIGNIKISKGDFNQLSNSLETKGLYTTNKSGAKITIGSGILNWCKQQWKS